MPPRRLAPVRDPVLVEVDGDRVEAQRGEPLAVAIAASGRLTLGRSVKYHRPRGAACYVGRCDGCLMRVDGVQSVMTCRHPARERTVAETQNVLGSARHDLLAAADWFFRDGMNHHEMFTWNEQVNRVMQKVARRIAGIGTLPDRALDVSRAAVREVDVLVVGSGPAGLRASTKLAEAGRDTLLLDEASALGGSLLWWPDAGASKKQLALELARASAAGVDSIADASVVAVYEPWEDVAGASGQAPAERDDAVVAVIATASGLLRIRPTHLVLANGRHEGASAFAGGDAPGVIGVRAACILLAHGVLPGERVLLSGAHPAMKPLADALRSAGADVLGPYRESALEQANGRPTVESCDVRVGKGIRTIVCDCIVVGAPTSAVYELAAQAGVGTRWSGSGFELVADPKDGSTDKRDVTVIGGAAAVAELDATLAQAEAAAARIAL